MQEVSWSYCPRVQHADLGGGGTRKQRNLESTEQEKRRVKERPVYDVRQTGHRLSSRLSTHCSALQGLRKAAVLSCCPLLAAVGHSGGNWESS